MRNYLLPVKRRYQKWTIKKKINLFEKDFVFIPINENSHWFLAIICNPGISAKMALEAPPVDDNKEDTVDLEDESREEETNPATPAKESGPIDLSDESVPVKKQE